MRLKWFFKKLTAVFVDAGIFVYESSMFWVTSEKLGQWTGATLEFLNAAIDPDPGFQPGMIQMLCWENQQTLRQHSKTQSLITKSEPIIWTLS